jgi:hypothetical protein
MLVRQAVLQTPRICRSLLTSCNPFRINTCKSVCKQRTLTPFKINTYEKTRGSGPVTVNQTSAATASDYPDHRSTAVPPSTLVYVQCNPFIFNQFQKPFLQLLSFHTNTNAPVGVYTSALRPLEGVCNLQLSNLQLSNSLVPISPPGAIQTALAPSLPFFSATLFPPWLAKGLANISYPISTGRRKSPAPFASRRIPPSRFRRTTTPAGSKSAPGTAN